MRYFVPWEKHQITEIYEATNGQEAMQIMQEPKAKTQLHNTTRRLSQISELVGYEDEKYFSRVFKKTTGQTPREYRKQ